MKVLILTLATLNTRKQVSSPSKTIDWTNPSDRKWLMNHLQQALVNGVSVALTPDESPTYVNDLRLTHSLSDALAIAHPDLYATESNRSPIEGTDS